MNNEKHLGSDPEDIEDVLKKIEKSYNIQFAAKELAHVRTFGELCDHIISKIKKEDIDNCTTQTAFYKLREAIVNSTQLDKSSIQTSTSLSSIFSRQQRRRQIFGIEVQLGFKLNVLRPKYFITWILAILTIASLVLLLFNWEFGLIGVASTTLLFLIANKTGIEFNDNTVGELADRIAQENYLQSRRNPTTVNKKEIVMKIEQLFIRDLGLSNDSKQIDPETIIVERK